MGRKPRAEQSRKHSQREALVRGQKVQLPRKGGDRATTRKAQNSAGSADRRKRVVNPGGRAGERKGEHQITKKSINK